MRREAGAGAAVGALGALALACSLPQGASAAPRDAIRNLPEITYTTEFVRLDPVNRGPDSPVRDDLLSTLDIDWAPPLTKLSSGVQFKPRWHAAIHMKDNLNRTAGISSDTRFEQFSCSLVLSKPETFSAAYSLRRADNWSSRGSASPWPAWDSESERQFDFDLTLKGLPAFTATNRVTDTYPPSDGEFDNGSRVEYSDYGLSYAKDAQAVHSEYRLGLKSTQSRNYRLSPVSDNATSVLEVSGLRSMPLGQLGRLQLSAYLTEHSSKLLGKLDADTSTTSAYKLDLSGNLAGLPAAYVCNCEVTNQDFPGSNSTRNVKRLLRFDVLPPVPQGKQSSLVLADSLDEWEDQSQSTLTNSQSMTWKMSFNPRTAAELRYQRINSLDRLTETQTKSSEGSLLDLSYQIPGGRGSLGGSLNQQTTSGIVADSLTAESSYSLRHSLRLGELASANFNLSQYYSDVSNGLITAGSTDRLSSSFSYYLGSSANYSLDFTWSNILERLGPGGKRTSTDALIVNVTWRPQPAWKYSLRLDTADSSELSAPVGGSETYKSNENVRLTVSYTF